jgi:epoxyqueuosine reductase
MCPTGAIVAPYIVDARRCISYLTIELKDAIPEELRPLIGNRIYGCDDCQLVCPVNRVAPLSDEPDFQRRPQWQDQSLIALLLWDEATFLKQTEGSAIRRIGFNRWQRNLAVAIGNAPYSDKNLEVLESVHLHADSMVREHIEWALAQQHLKQQQADRENRQQQRLIRIIQLGLPRDA